MGRRNTQNGSSFLFFSLQNLNCKEGGYIMGQQKVRIRIRNWDVDAYRDLITNQGFIINEPGQIDLDGVTKKTYNGPQSPRYGPCYGDEQEAIEGCRCECGAFSGKMFLGETCPLCETKVIKREENVKMTGWIPYGKNRIVNPYYHEKLKRLMGKNGGRFVFPDILDTKQRVDVNGKVSALTEEEKESPSSPYAGIGLELFLRDFEEIIDYFAGKKKNKATEFEKIKREKRKVFTSFTPVYTLKLRPQSATSDTLYYTGIDKEINPLIRLSQDLQDCMPIEKPLILSKIQYRVNKMWDFNFGLINSKDGFIKDKLIGGSMNYSARNVIIPDPSLKINEIDMSYQTFRIIYAYYIINAIMKQDHIPLYKAYDRWKRSFSFDSYVYEAMKFVLKTIEPRALINRNPTLNIYNVLLMKIRQVKPDANDYTLSVGLQVLPGMNADFDGDILGIYGIPLREMVQMFRKYDPAQCMLIDRATGLLNGLFGLQKSQAIDLYHYATLK